MAVEEHAPARMQVDYDPTTGVETWMVVHGDGRITIQLWQDDTHIRRYAQEVRNDRIKNERSKDFEQVAAVPLLVRHDLNRRGIIGDSQEYKKWLNSEEARPYRTSDKVV